MNNTKPATLAETEALRAAMAAATPNAPIFVATIRGIFERLPTSEEIEIWRAWQTANGKIDPSDVRRGVALDVACIFDERHVLTPDGYSITRYTGPVNLNVSDAQLRADYM